MTCLSPSRLLNYQARAWLYASLSRCVLEGWIVRTSCQSPFVVCRRDRGRGKGGREIRGIATLD